MNETTRRGLLQAPAALDWSGGSFDVVVVGARVAGAATALHLARTGHKVLIVDRAGPPADTTSTHALMRTGTLALRQAGVLDTIIAAGTPPIREINLVFGEERISFPVADAHGVDAYYAPRRTVLDPILLQAAIDAGASFVPEVSVNGVSWDSRGRVDGITVRDGGPIPARWVIGADGTQSRVARSVNAPLLRYHPPSNALVYAYFGGVDRPGYDFRFVDQRNVGAIPTNDGLTVLFVGGPLAEASRDGESYLMTTLARLAPDLVANGRRVGRLYRANGIPNVLRDPAGPGWNLVGDAGFTEDPISARGITDALRDAVLCAEAIDRSLRDPADEPEAQAAYRQTRDRFAVPLLDRIVDLASYNWEGPKASRLLRELGEIADAECELLSESILA